MKKPNLFSFATGELSQDAFISWLLDWGNPSNEAENSSLHQLGREFLLAILAKANVTIPESIDSIQVIQQQDKIDVVAVVNDSVVVLIEDKTGTSDHSDQLLRYKEAAKARYNKQEIVPVYFKIYDQCDFDRIQKLGYCCFLRGDIIKFFDMHWELARSSEIVSDYVEHVENINQRINSFATLPPREWISDSWCGFFSMIQDRLGQPVEWSYVSNRSGGFMGYWWNWSEDHPCYLQLEEEKLCFKLAAKDDSQRSSGWDKWHEAARAAGDKCGLEFVRPQRKSIGKWMTVAYHPLDYRQANDGGNLNVEATLEVLKKAELVLVEAVKNGVSHG